MTADDDTIFAHGECSGEASQALPSFPIQHPFPTLSIADPCSSQEFQLQQLLLQQQMQQQQQLQVQIQHLQQQHAQVQQLQQQQLQQLTAQMMGLSTVPSMSASPPSPGSSGGLFVPIQQPPGPAMQQMLTAAMSQQQPALMQQVLTQQQQAMQQQQQHAILQQQQPGLPPVALIPYPVPVPVILQHQHQQMIGLTSDPMISTGGTLSCFSPPNPSIGSMMQSPIPTLQPFLTASPSQMQQQLQLCYSIWG
jgi:hypothetical protein